MSAGLRRFEPDTDPERIAEHVRRYGYAIVDDVAPTGLLDRIDAEARPWIDASDPGRDVYDGRHTRRTGALVARVPAVRQLIMHPLALGVAGHVMAQATTFQLHLTQLIAIGPGESAQQLHRDQMAFDFYPFPPDYHAQCNTMWALTDFTAENGATHVAPGTGAMDDETAAAVAPLQAEMRRGGVLFYDGKVLHGGGANRSTGDRVGINLTYCVGWVRQEENQYLACPPEVARTLDDDLLRLMGYQQGAFALGYVGDQTDPQAALRGEDAKTKLVSEFADANQSFRSFVDDLDRG
ncbi:MAG: phytanoyl-CoA dioxygenase family protein [Actinomycetota bacterium]